MTAAGISLRMAWLAIVAVALVACTYGTSAPAEDTVNPQLVALGAAESVKLADGLEALIAVGEDTTEDREYAYWMIAQREAVSAADAFARASTAGRVAELKGLNAGSLVSEAERFAALSRDRDPEFREGAAQTMLGTLYVHAPAAMLENGDSEEGLSLLREVVERWPNNTRNKLRLAEAFVALGDEEPAYPLLCWCLVRQHQYSPDERALLVRMVEDVELEGCALPPTGG